MRLINSSFEIIEQKNEPAGMWKHIERCARVAYKSEDKITSDSYNRFCKMLVDRGHLACLEQGTVYLKIPYILNDEYSGEWVESRYGQNPYSRVYCDGSNYYITTNQRVIHENEWVDDVDEFWCLPEEQHYKRYCVKVTCSRGISHEIVRHRAMSFIQSSQRYINYSFDKFGSELTFIIPEWIYNVRDEIASTIDLVSGKTKTYLYQMDGLKLIKELACEDRSIACWYNNLRRCEEDYMFLTTTDESYKLKPQEARGVLNNDCMTEICICGFVDQWNHFFELRTASDAHPDFQVIAKAIKLEFEKRNYLNE